MLKNQTEKEEKKDKHREMGLKRARMVEASENGGRKSRGGGRKK